MSLSLAAAKPRIPQLTLSPWLMTALIVGAAFAWHIPVRGLRGGDDPFFIEVARLWLSGSPPYLSAFDVKPPGYFALLALAELVFGPTQAAVNGLSMICEAGTALCLYALGRRLGRPEAGVFAAFGYPLLSQTLADNPGYPPLALFTTAAFLMAASGTRIIAAGLAIGFAATIKQSACLEAGALLWWLLRETEGSRLRAGGLFVASATVAPLGFAAIFAVQGAFGAFFSDVVLTALRRPDLEAENFKQILTHFVSVQRKVTPLLALAALGLARLSALTPKPVGAQALVVWLAASWVELWLQHARWVLYLGPSLAPLLLLAGLSVSAAIRATAPRSLALAILLAVTAAHVWPYRYWQLLGPEDAALYQTAAKAVAARGPAVDDRLLGVGVLETAELNTRTGLKPPTAYFYWLHLACDFPGAGPARLREAFASAPRFVVTAVKPYHPYCEDPAAWPFVSAALAADYTMIEQAAGEANGLVVFERKTRP